jgi:acetyl-CoA carboxylase biotin carboxylase subunit
MSAQRTRRPAAPAPGAAAARTAGSVAPGTAAAASMAPAPQRPPFSKVLIANRGEISVRVQHALRELGITAVAVYSEPDREALHTITADEAWPVGPGPSAESYLRIDRMLEAARRSGATAIHPGYGFLSENPQFSQAVADAGLTFIGPPPEPMRKMGNKIAARRLMEQAGVPVVPGLTEPLRDLAQAQAFAQRIGYPVMLKAAAGGGGKGMRVVQRPELLATALERTQGEALGAFGDGEIFMEKSLQRPRHIEVQILADTHGQCVHLFERECSVQRRHQKVIEESPSPSIGPALRQQLCTAAVKAAQSAGYVGAGTVEFIVDEQDNFYFLEMNTRLQVEHPVTEWVVGVDLVAAMVRVAAGEPLPFRQEDLRQRGHAIEFRIYAEDPWRDFAPSLGRVIRLQPPQGAGVRNDLGIREGYEIPIYYDPLLAKLIVYGEGRAAAIARGRRALAEYRLLGFAHNVPLHQWVLQQPEFLAGRYSTHFLGERFKPDELRRELRADELDALAAALALAETGAGGTSDTGGAGDARGESRESGAPGGVSGPAGCVPPPLSRWGTAGRSLVQRRPK